MTAKTNGGSVREGYDFVVVSNRLPVDRVVGANGKASWEHSPGGLVTALEPVMQAADGAWVGWAGQADHEFKPFVSDGIHIVPVTLTADVTISGTTTSSDANVINGAFNWGTGGLTTTGNVTGTATLLFNGTGTWTGAAGSLANNCTINTAGTLTLSGTLLYTTGTLTYTAGTVSAGSSILSIGGNSTLATNGMTWANITLSAALTLTLSSLLSVSGTFTLPNAAVTLAGAGNFSVGTLTTATITAARVYTMDTGNTYTITSALTIIGLVGGHVSFAGSSVAGTKAIMTLAGAASQDVGFCDATDIDSSLGQAIFSYKGTLTRATNWTATAPLVVGVKGVGGSG